MLCKVDLLTGFFSPLFLSLQSLKSFLQLLRWTNPILLIRMGSARLIDRSMVLLALSKLLSYQSCFMTGVLKVVLHQGFSFSQQWFFAFGHKIKETVYTILWISNKNPSLLWAELGNSQIFSWTSVEGCYTLIAVNNKNIFFLNLQCSWSIRSQTVIKDQPTILKRLENQKHRKWNEKEWPDQVKGPLNRHAQVSAG